MTQVLLERSREDGSSRVCNHTGLQLLATTGQASWRIAKASYGPLNPPKRPTGGDRRSWGRYDVPGQQVVYVADRLEAAFAECLAAFRVADDLQLSTVDELFANELNDGQRPLIDQVREEWEERHHMGPGCMPAGWRFDRLMYSLTLPNTGWLVDVSHSNSLGSLQDHLRPTLDALGIGDLTLGIVGGEDREATTAISEWIWNIRLDDGSLPHGIVYPSKYGDDYTCAAVYLRRLGDGFRTTSEPTTADSGAQIPLPEHFPPLATIAARFNLHCF